MGYDDIGGLFGGYPQGLWRALLKQATLSNIVHSVIFDFKVAYLEGILASRLVESAQKEERKKKRQAHRPTEVGEDDN